MTHFANDPPKHQTDLRRLSRSIASTIARILMLVGDVIEYEAANARRITRSS